MTPVKNWHATAAFGVHYERYPSARDTVLGRDITYDYLAGELKRIRPDYLQYVAKSTAGFSNYDTIAGTPSPGIASDQLAVVRQVTSDLGIKLVIGYAGLWDAQAVQEHPEWVHIESSGQPGPVHVNLRAVAQVCPSSGYVDERMIPQMLEIIDRYDPDGFWIDADGWVLRACWCERCCAAFTSTYGAPPPRSHDEPLWEEWIEVNASLYSRYVEKYLRAVADRKPECGVAVNWLYSVPQTGRERMPVGYLSGDCALAFASDFVHVEARFFDDHGTTWDLIHWMMTKAEPGHDGTTIKTAPQLCQEAAVTLAAGGNVQFFDLQQETGRIIDWHQDILRSALDFCEERRDVVNGRSVPQIAVLNGRARAPLANEPIFGMRSNAKDPVRGAVQALLDNHFHVDVISERSLLERGGEYAMIVIPDGTRLSSDVVRHLDELVHAGLRLLIAGADTVATTAGLAGVRAVGDAVAGFRSLATGGESTVVAGPWQPLVLDGAKTLLPLLDGDDPEIDRTPMPGVTMLQRGAGRVAVVPGGLFGHFYRNQFPRTRQLVEFIVDALEPDVDLEVEAPPWVHASLRHKDSSLIVHLVNNGAAPALSNHRVIVEHVPPVDGIVVRLRVETRPAEVRAVPPQATLDWDWADGWLTANLDRLSIHTALVVDR